MESTEFWKIPLADKPEINHLDFGYHMHSSVDRYRIHGLWLLNFYHYPADLVLNGQHYAIDYGTIGVVAPDTDMEYRYHTPGFHDRFVHFALPAASAHTENIPVVYNLGADFKQLNQEFEDIINSHQRRPGRAEAKVWDILWMLVERSSVKEDTNIHPALQTAMDYIEANLDGAIHPVTIAERTGISYPHLARLFQQSYNTTISSHVRRRRVERAEYLLKFTNIHIKDIAAQVGIPDLHTFNKTVRKELVKSPSEIRKTARSQ